MPRKIVVIGITTSVIVLVTLAIVVPLLLIRKKDAPSTSSSDSSTSTSTSTSYSTSSSTSSSAPTRNLVLIHNSVGEPTITVGQQFQLSASGLYDDDTGGDISTLVTWGYDPSIISVDSNAIATGLAPGVTGVGTSYGSVPDDGTGAQITVVAA